MSQRSICRKPLITGSFKVWLLSALIFSVVFCLLYSICPTMSGSSDMRFLYNRAWNVLDCLKEGELPLYYGNDLGGIGYGVSFYYPSVTLFPFLPFVGLGYEAFAKAFLLAASVLIFLGVSRFAYACHCEDSGFIGFLVLSGYCTYAQMLMTCLPVNLFGFGLACFFFAYFLECVRDGGEKALCLSVVFWFLLVSTHLLSSLFAFACCLVIFVMYFDKRKLGLYFRLASWCLVASGYVLGNVLYHSGTFRSIMPEPGKLQTFSLLPLGGVVFHVCSFLYEGLFSGIGFVDVIPLAVLAVLLVRHKPSRRCLAVLIIAAFAWLVGTGVGYKVVGRFGWLANLIYYPTVLRYGFYVLLALYVVGFKRGCWGFAKAVLAVSGFISIVVVFLFTSNEDLVREKDYELPSGVYFHEATISGEYFTEGFVEDFGNIRYNMSHAFSFEDGFEYWYTSGINGAFIVVRANDIIQVPKLWYNGFVADGDADVYCGSNQFIVIKTGNIGGEVNIRYDHPMFLYLLCVVSWSSVIYLVLSYLIHRYEKS